MTAIRKNVGNFAAILGLVVIAAGVGGYILSNQRLRFPLIEDKPIKLKAEFATAQAVTPGQGQTVRVSGVRIGDLSKVDLVDGKAIVTMDIDAKYEGLVHQDATALLRPKTGLKDMFVELDPGTNAAPVASENWTIPIKSTLPDINPDEVFATLDGDTREYLKLLVSGAGKGLEDRGGDLREVFRRFEPTHRDLARVTGQVATRRKNLKRLITSLNDLNTELATKDDEIAQLIDSSAAVFRAFASEQNNLSATVRELPSALKQTTRTLTRVEDFARILGPASENLRPAVRALDDANREVRPFALEVAPIVEKQIRPFVREVRPLVKQLRPAAQGVAKATPDLTRSFVILNRLFDLLGYNDKGRQSPDIAGRDEGFLFQVAWAGHQAVNLFSSSDAHGTFRPTTAAGTCATLEQLAKEEGAEFLLGLTPILTSAGACG